MGPTIRATAVRLLGLAVAAHLPYGGAGHRVGRPSGEGLLSGLGSGGLRREPDGLSLLQRALRDEREPPRGDSPGASGAEAFEQEYARRGLAREIHGDHAKHREAKAFIRSEKNNSAKLKHRIVLHHIWKVGGTHLCEVARESGLRVPLNPGCHRLANSSVADTVDAPWGPCAVGPGLADIPFDVVGHECGINEYVLDEATEAGFMWVGMVRDPVQQAYSWYGHAKRGGRQEATMTEWLEACHGDESGCGFYQLIPNLQTRWLAGGDCTPNPETEGCVEKALASLQKMAVVLEQDENKVKGLEKLERLGWTAKEREDSGFVSESADILSSAPEAEIARVTELQHLDVRLLREARSQGLI